MSKIILSKSFINNSVKLALNEDLYPSGDITSNLIIKSTHPSPYSAASGFFGSKPFSKTNEYLDDNGLSCINWELWIVIKILMYKWYSRYENNIGDKDESNSLSKI